MRNSAFGCDAVLINYVSYFILQSFCQDKIIGLQNIILPIKSKFNTTAGMNSFLFISSTYLLLQRKFWRYWPQIICICTLKYNRNWKCILCEQNVKLQPAGCEPLPKLNTYHVHSLHNNISNIYCMSRHVYVTCMCNHVT